MTDEAYVLMETNRERSSIKRSAANKVNGCKSRKCTLPSDYMTKKELNKMNGEVKVYNLNGAMTKEEFVAMPTDLQAKYLDICYENGAGDIQIATMFKVHKNTIRRWRNTLGVKGLGHGGNRYRYDYRQSKWEQFISGKGCEDTHVENVDICEQPEDPVERSWLSQEEALNKIKRDLEQTKDIDSHKNFTVTGAKGISAIYNENGIITGFYIESAETICFG